MFPRFSRHRAPRLSGPESELLHGVSHELRTPLGAILGFAQLLESDELSPAQRESVEHIAAAARHLLGLSDQLLAFAAAGSAQRGRTALAPVELGPLVGRSVALCAPLAAEHGLELHSDVPRTGHMVLADPTSVTQILLNLLSNAIKYNRPGGSVTVRVVADGTALGVEVHDTGSGIGHDQLRRLFSPFERLDAAERGIEGAGLGLAISKALAEAMGGAISIDSQPGLGSTFALRLSPVVAPARAPVEALTAPC